MNLPQTSYQNFIRRVSGSITLYPTDVILECDTSSAPTSMTLGAIPQNYYSTSYKLYVFDYSSNCGTNNITINAGTGTDGTQQKINGANSITLSIDGSGVLIRILSNSSYMAVAASSATGHVIQDEGISLTQRIYLNFVGSGVTATDAGGKTVVTIPGGVTQAYTTIQDEGGTPLPQRTTINFVGGGVTAADAGGVTVVTIPTQQAYSTVQDEGVSVTQRSVLNFVGGGVTVTDDGPFTKTLVTIPGSSWTAPSYFYAYKSLTTGATSFNIAPVAGGVNSVFGGLQVIEYTSKVESGLTFNSSAGEFTVPSTGLYSLNAKFTTRIHTTDINSIVNGTGDPWTVADTSQLAIGILIERSSGSPNLVVCSNKQTINSVNISDINIECSSLLFSLTQNDVVYVVIFNKTTYTIVNLAVTSGLPVCFVDFSCFKIS